MILFIFFILFFNDLKPKLYLFVALKFYVLVKAIAVFLQIRINSQVITMLKRQMISQLNILKAIGL